MREEGMASLTEEDMTLIQEVIKLMAPLKVGKPHSSVMISPIQAKLQRNFQPDESALPVIADVVLTSSTGRAWH